jgi:hypothetical protein
MTAEGLRQFPEGGERNSGSLLFLLGSLPENHTESRHVPTGTFAAQI